ncbi:MAG: ATP-binding protein [Bacteroidetes bacterium]|nr:ATP-binding protein [Bacteroidota bacterium]
MDLIGRYREVSILTDAIDSKRPELIVVYGRRRIGKTYLVRNVCRENIVVEFTGMNRASMRSQMKNFHFTLSQNDVSLRMPSDWIEAFRNLSLYLDKLTTKRKKVVFIDEFPWFDTRKSNFLAAFDLFWNSYASKRSDLVVVICGSAASYIIKKIIRSKGGLHNRITTAVRLEPFSLHETEIFLKKNGVSLTRYDIVNLYMALGGIPYYLEKIRPGESAAQAIERLCFKKNGFLRNEFGNIFAALFDQPDNHEAIIISLASARKGLTRNEIIKKTKLKTGGTVTKTLLELEESGFIERYLPYKGTKDTLFRLTDEYSLFYIRFIRKTRPSNRSVWPVLSQQQSFKIWAGFTFETICMKHTEQIMEGLKIAGISFSTGAWLAKGTENGCQIDMLIDRADNVINICEMKFCNSLFEINSKYAKELIGKVNNFVSGTGTKKSIFLTFITTYGLVQNKYRKQLVQNELTLDHLFVPV